MQTQLNLIDVPRSRTTDPDSSHIAADHIKACGALAAQQDIVFRFIRLHQHLTTRELARAYARAYGGNEEKHNQMFHRRCPELEGIRLKTGESRKCRISGRTCQVWTTL